ncbi:hypothetical protein [Sulfurovum mangrovi]|uniref:hypothetical protein n=1 Tax=Sulfurovum mangrovi TaxID=2893889 RepID=UPI001E590E51|nr:hypothetical protein [Sulfurovum mangrovi]UFH59823.1 hypothetical protein LN246_03020 [Sulfurovum mangrovi]UFH59874.1 hypothetical protein LN246_03280 [Sulfurovum mangrovi]
MTDRPDVNSMMDMINQCWIGTELARELGLNSRFFARLHREKPKSLAHGIEIHSTGGLVLVRIPSEISNMIRSKAYTAVKIVSDDDTKYDHVFEITTETKVGFWR